MSRRIFSECFRANEVELKLRIPPQYLGQLEQYCKEILNGCLLKWHSQLHGIVLAYDDVAVTSRLGQVIWDQPPVRYTVKAKLYTFTPVHGALLVGTINNVGWDHIGLSVLGYFSASILQPQLREGWYIDGTYLVSPDSVSLTVGDKLCFEILDIGEYNDQTNSGTFHLEGSLLRGDTGVVDDATWPQLRADSLAASSSGEQSSKRIKREKKVKKEKKAKQSRDSKRKKLQ